MLIFNIAAVGVAAAWFIASALFHGVLELDARLASQLAFGVALLTELSFRALYRHNEGLTWPGALFGPAYGGTLFWVLPLWLLMVLMLPALFM